MVNTFVIKDILSDDDVAQLITLFDFKKLSPNQLKAVIQKAFAQYIISALDEMRDDEDARRRVYIEAAFHIDKAKKLLKGMPHPAGKMSYRLGTMQDTLHKLIEGNDNFAAERASRFMEKNLVRRLRDIWHTCTSQPFTPGNSSGHHSRGHSPRDFIIFCFNAAAKQYPEISWFRDVDYKIADMMIKKIR